MLAAITDFLFPSFQDEEEEEAPQPVIVVEKETPPPPPPKILKRPRKEEKEIVPAKLGDRAIPGDLLQRGLNRIAAVRSNNVVYSLSDDKTVLTVNVPKTRKRRKDYHIPHHETLTDLLADIRETMQEDGFTWMDSLRMASEYPLFFWDCMFHFLGQVELVDAAFNNGRGNKRQRRQNKK